MSKLTVVVAGVPGLANMLTRTTQFETVHEVTSTIGLRDIVTGPLRGASRQEVVFLFGDTLMVDDERFPLNLLLQKLSTGGWKCLVVALSPKAADLVRANPQAGILPLPVTTNIVLGAVASFNLTGGAIEPVQENWAFAELDVLGNGAPISAQNRASWGSPAPAPAAPQAAPPARASWGAPTEAPAEPTGRRGAAPTPAPEPSRAWGAPTEAPVEPPKPRRSLAEATGGWGAPTETPEPSRAWGAPAEAPEPSRAWGAPTEAPVEPAGWGAPAAEPAGAWGAPTEAPPATWASTPAPVKPSWGMPTDAPTEDSNPFAGRRSLAGLANGQDSPEAAWQPGASRGPVARPGGYQAQRQGPTRLGKVITIAVSKGGVGKSSLSLNLAAFLGLRLRAEGKTVCVVDVNFQQADTGKYLEVFHPNVMSIVNDSTLLTRERIVQALVHKPEYNLSALLGPAKSDDGNPQWITARLYNEIIDLLKELYDYIIIDTPVAEKFHSIFSEFALPRADFIIVPVTPSNVTLHNADNWLRSAVTAPRHANGAGIPPEKIGIVLNRAKDNVGVTEDDVRANLANWNFLGSVPETDEWQRANNEFRLVAADGYTELNEAFAHVLYAATGEEALVESFRQPGGSSGGLAAKLKGLFGKKGR